MQLAPLDGTKVQLQANSGKQQLTLRQCRRGWAMPKYEFRLLKTDGTVSVQTSEFCVNQEEANGVARRLWTLRPESDRIEIWLGRDCYYRGRPTQWPFRPAKRGDLHSTG